MSTYDPETKRFLCECGCGEEVVDFLSDFKRGHNLKTEEGSNGMSEALSGCIKSEEHQRNINESLLESWRNDPGRHRRQSETLSGLVRSSESVENIRRARLEFLDSEEGKRWADEHSEFMAGLVLGPHSEESKREASESNLGYWREHPRPCGEGSPRWKGGLVGYYGYGWKAASEFTKVRDGFVCQGCGYKGANFGDLIAHHIDGDTLNWDEKNLITTCRSCNSKAATKSEERYWFDFYAKKIEEIYATVIAS